MACSYQRILMKLPAKKVYDVQKFISSRNLIGDTQVTG
jgi:hypothetical protein